MAAVLWTARLYEEKFSRCLFNIVLHLTYWAGLCMTGPVSSIRITEEKDTARSHPNLADTLPKQKKVGSWTFPQQLKFRHVLLNVLHILDHLATLLYEPQHVTVHHCVVKTRSPRNVCILQSTLSWSSAEGPKLEYWMRCRWCRAGWRWPWCPSAACRCWNPLDSCAAACTTPQSGVYPGPGKLSAILKKPL